MSRFYNNCVDEASLTTLCPICLDSFQGAKGVRVRRADPKQKIKDVCTYCQIRYGFDYYVQPDKNAGQYVKRYQERAVANGSLMMCEVQGAKEDFIRRWNTIFKEYPDVFEDSDCRKIIHNLTEDAVQYLLKIKEKTI